MTIRDTQATNPLLKSTHNKRQVELSCLFYSLTGKSRSVSWIGGWWGVVARLIGNGNNWPVGSVCPMGVIGSQSFSVWKHSMQFLKGDIFIWCSPLELHPPLWSGAPQMALLALNKEFWQQELAKLHQGSIFLKILRALNKFRSQCCISLTEAEHRSCKIMLGKLI